MTEEGSDVVRRERFSGGPAREFLSSMRDDATTTDERIFEADLAVDRAHVVMLEEQGIVDAESTGAVLDALAEIETAGFAALPEGEDVHAAIETAVIERVGPEGGRMHTARSRNDEVAACIRHRLRVDLLDAAAATIELREVLADVAAGHLHTTMPGYTHRQPAQPTTVAHWLCSYGGALARDTARLRGAYGRTNRSPLGAAAFAGTTFDVDRERTADLLGFEGVVENAMDAVSARDFLIEAAGAVATVSTTLSGLATDLIEFAADGYVEINDDYASTSSIMPQKKNPDTLELVRARAGDASAGLNGLLTTLKGLPRAYNRDLQRATPHVWRTVDATTAAAEVTAGAVSTAEWNGDALAAAAGEGFGTATGVADLLAAHGTPFRTAHEVVAHAAEAITDGTSGGDAAPDRAVEGRGEANDDVATSYAALDAAAREVLGERLAERVPREAVEAALDPGESVASRDSRGGPAPEAVRAFLTDAEAGIEADADWIEARREGLAAATERLDRAVSTYG
jgi:argininosuccinate lyase